jgi:hypothetical protein
MTPAMWKVPNQILAQTSHAFGRGAHEVFVMWTAQLHTTTTGSDNGTIDVTRCIVPEQMPGQGNDGVWVHIDGRELQRIQLDNYAKGERSIVQLHTHPSSDVRMSLLDRQWEVVRHVGALSIIVPHYGARGLPGFPGVNVYEREERDWRLWPNREVQNRLIIV